MANRERPDFALSSVPDTTDRQAQPTPRVVELARDAVSQIEPSLAPLTPAPIADELGDGLSLGEAASYLGWSEQEVRQAIKARSLLAHETGAGELSVPGFQLAGEPLLISPAVVGALELLAPACDDPRTLLAWFCAPKDELSGATPVAWIQDGGPAEAVLLAARRDAARLG